MPSGRGGKVVAKKIEYTWGAANAPEIQARVEYPFVGGWHTEDKATADVMHSHYASAYLVPSTPNLRLAIKSAAKGDTLRFKGSLMDVTGPDGFWMHTARSLTEQKCQTVWVTELQIGERVYR